MGLLSAVVFIFSFAHIVLGQVRTVDYGENQLLFYQERKTFDQARLACQKDNNDLVIVRDAKLQAFITPYLNSSMNKSLWRGPWAVGYWIGGYRPAASTTWYWWDRTILASQPPSPNEYNNWVGIEPNGNTASKMCIAMTPYPSLDGHSNIKGGWVDDVCYDLKYYICTKDICAPNPCFNGGICMKGMGEYQCNCKPGFIGSKCDVTDQCTTAPCNNGGTCSMVGNNYTCSCVFGFTGTNCEKDSCSSSPCQNDGTCTKLPNHYICSCLDGFGGYNCDKAAQQNLLEFPSWIAPLSMVAIAISAICILSIIWMGIRIKRLQSTKLSQLEIDPGFIDEPETSNESEKKSEYVCPIKPNDNHPGNRTDDQHIYEIAYRRAEP